MALRLTELDALFQGWPTDVEAASPTREDIMRLIDTTGCESRGVEGRTEDTRQLMNKY